MDITYHGNLVEAALWFVIAVVLARRAVKGGDARKIDAKLAPAVGSMERYKLMEWLNFIATEVHKQIGALFNPKLTPEMREVQLAVIERRMNALDKMAAGKQYLMGDAFSVADAYLFNIMLWAKKHNIDIAKWPNVAAINARIGERPNVVAAMKAEGLIK